MKKLIFIICLPLNLFGQNTIGLPDVINYSKQSYAAGLQNWDIKQDRNGVIYIANNEGLLSFDSKYWNLYPLPNKTIVRSVEIGTDNRIYAGGQDELGYFSPAVNGRLQYHSLTHLIPAKDRSFGDVWDIVSLNKNVFFRTTGKIFKFTNESVAVFDAPSEWSYIGLCNGKMYAHDFKAGLMNFENDVMAPVPSATKFSFANPVTSILSINKDSAIVTTLKSGLFILSPAGISKLQCTNNTLFENDRIYAATLINKERMALATNNSGVYICDFKGNIIQQFSRKEGLQNDNVLSIFSDHQSNLWLGLDNGVDFIAYDNAIKQIKPLHQDGSGYAVLIYNNLLYTGTSNGLFSVPLEGLTDFSFSKGNFSAVNNSKGQVWGLAEINNQVLMSHHEGSFIVKDNTAVPVSTLTGYWNFIPLSSIFPSPQIIGGNYKGVRFFDFSNQQFTQSNTVADFTESSRFMAVDKVNNIWVSHPYHGVFRIYKTITGSYHTEAYTEKNGLPSALNNHIFKLKNELVAATEKGVYVYNYSTNKFEPAAFYKNILGSGSVRYVKEDAAGNVWFIHEKMPGVIDFSGKQPSVIYLPELNNKLLSGFEFIYPVNKNNIFFGGENGFFHLNYEKYKQTEPALQVYIRTVRIAGNKDSLLYGGYFKEINDQVQTDIPGLDHYWKNVRFEFSTSFFGQQSNLVYSYRLKGLDKDWSEWSARTEKEYTNLSESNYVFEVKVRNNLGKESAATLYSFKILPPWYLNAWAKVFYLLLFTAFNYAFYAWLKKKFRRQQEKFEAEQKRLKYIHQLELEKNEKEIIQLQNEKLANEIIFKQRELADANLHLVERGDALLKVKEELQKIYKKTGENHDIKKTLHLLNDIEKNNSNWEQFASHFDEVNNDFLKKLKQKFPVLSKTDLKVCAYLQLNLSSKEIAQLMNISVRGVEISRYRLRKKLLVPTEQSLGDFFNSL